jgi:hypothetical protein
MMKHDVRIHKRFLDYQERHVYFGRNIRLLAYEEFATLDTELAALDAKGVARDDEEEARFEELTEFLLLD